MSFLEKSDIALLLTTAVIPELKLNIEQKELGKLIANLYNDIYSTIEIGDDESSEKNIKPNHFVKISTEEVIAQLYKLQMKKNQTSRREL